MTRINENSVNGLNDKEDDKSNKVRIMESICLVAAGKYKYFFKKLMYRYLTITFRRIVNCLLNMFICFPKYLSEKTYF